jgi:RNA-directed DNA polymerase
MPLGDVRHQKSGGPERTTPEDREAGTCAARDETNPARHGNEDSGTTSLLRQALARENMAAAWKRVKANRGSAGVDGLTIEQTAEYLKSHWPEIRDPLLSGQYRPQAVRSVEIPKPTGGVRQLGIPTVIDRLIQQALLQVLHPLIDPTFSRHSYGFRPGRSAHDAVRQAQRYVEEGFQTVVDVDLEKFFDRVNHDILMDRLAKRIDDKGVLRLMRRYLEAGAMRNGVAMDRVEGTPQGGPLSPLLANALLDEVDKDLERRGHRFVRYADDCNVYVRSQKAGERVLESLRRLYHRLRLVVNEGKTAVAPVFGRNFLGYCLRRWSGNTVKLAVSPKALKTFKERVRTITQRVGGRSMAQVAEELRKYLPGWKSYFQLARTPQIFKDLDSWLRHRLRAIQLKQWRRGTTIYRKVRALGATEQEATHIAGACGRWWHCSEGDLHRILTVRYFDAMGIPRLS